MTLLTLPRPAVFLVAGVVLALLPVGPPLGANAEDEEVRVLYPPDGAIVTTSPALVMIIGPDVEEAPDLRLDGSPLLLRKMAFAEAWKEVPGKITGPAGSDDLPLRSSLLEEKAGKALWMAAEAFLTDGGHEIALEGTALATFSSRAPADGDATTWEQPVLRVHASPTSLEEALDCTQCHEARSADQPTLGVSSIPAVCHTCHTDVDLSLAHEHVMEFLAKCQMCHDPHASTRPSLLIDTRAQVCAQCHESGYSM